MDLRWSDGTLLTIVDHRWAEAAGTGTNCAATEDKRSRFPDGKVVSDALSMAPHVSDALGRSGTHQTRFFLDNGEASGRYGNKLLRRELWRFLML